MDQEIRVRQRRTSRQFDQVAKQALGNGLIYLACGGMFAARAVRELVYPTGCVDWMAECFCAATFFVLAGMNLRFSTEARECKREIDLAEPIEEPTPAPPHERPYLRLVKDEDP